MASNLKKMLEDVSNNPDLQARYKKNKEAVMDEYQLTDEEKAIVNAQDLKSLNQKLGGEYDFEPNGIIKINKKS